VLAVLLAACSPCLWRSPRAPRRSSTGRATASAARTSTAPAVNETFIDLLGGATSVAVGARHIYWMQTLSTTGSARVPPPIPGAIGRAQLDGTQVDEDFITGFDAGGALAVDEQHIYWTESFLGRSVI
jgi:hypothetical protein